MNKPIIIAGMHRSGTSLLSRILSDLGVFMGKKVSGNHEAKFFQELNIWLFNELGGRWDYPPKMDYLFENKEMLDLTLTYIDQLIQSSKFVKYLGWKHYVLRNYFLKKQGKLWGWKDPRNIYTLPLWQKLFPEAKVIYIERHGVDVANSLRKRSLKGFQKRKDDFQRPKKLYSFDSGRFGLSSESIRCCTLEGGFSLWEEYICQGRKNISSMNAGNLLVLQYEELLKNPSDTITKIEGFLGLEQNIQEQQPNISVKENRAYAYRNKPELQEFADRVSSRLMNYEYEA